MITPIFWLDTRNKDRMGRSFLFLRICKNRKKHFVSTRIKLQAKFWDHRKQKILQGPEHDSLRLNNHLNSIRSLVSGFSVEASSKGGDPVSYVLEQLRPKSASTPQYEFFEGLDKYIESLTLTKKAATVKTYRSLRESLTAYAKRHRATLTFKTVNVDFLNRWKQFLSQEMENTDTTIQKKVAQLKVYLKHAYESGWTEVAVYSKFTHPRGASSTIALTEEEVEKIRSLDLANRPGVANTRDCFLVGCYTGLRYGDWSQLRRERFHQLEDGTWELKLVTQKTNQEINIPVPPAAIHILEAHEFKLPVVSNQKTNGQLKEIARLSGIAGVVAVVTTSNQTKKEQWVPRHMMVTTHTARRTFATLVANKGVSLHVIQTVLGHATIEQTREYIKTTPSDIRLAMKGVFQ